MGETASGRSHERIEAEKNNSGSVCVCGAEPRQGPCLARHLNCEKSDPGACGRRLKAHVLGPGSSVVVI